MGGVERNTVPRHRDRLRVGPRSHVGRQIVHWGIFGENVLISAREEMKRGAWIEGPRVASKLVTINGAIKNLQEAIAIARAFGHEALVAEGGLHLDILTEGREGVQRYTAGLPGGR